MTRIFLTSMVTVFGLVSAPALAEPVAALAPHRSATADLPLTDAFASALGRYRDCVVGAVGSGAVASPEAMARAAMTRCTRARDYVRAQLIADISTGTAGLGVDETLVKADAGMAAIEPMIAAVASEEAHGQISHKTQ